MRSRLSTAFLLVLSSIFLAGGLPAQHVLAISAQVAIAPAEPGGHRQAAPQPVKPKAAADTGTHHGFGGLAVPPARAHEVRLARGTARTLREHRAPKTGPRTAHPARAPPLHRV
ncbi:hypothetical protein [Nonomuraea typhae]|uniref:hypothetical protein n=1 Tax=Nonomuraea typhae TaxID=2603600 RepID=UPI0012FB3AF5|nr:hypothetical protein [Nonomuraea typhae]